ncbi:MAG: FAD-dependent thymidylate synthase [Candidatus Caldatribacteriota bacterium]
MEEKILAVPYVELVSITPNAESLIYRCASISRGRKNEPTEEEKARLIQKLIKMGHESVLEHAVATFFIRTTRDVSHQLVRHRLASFTQVSQRYVDQVELGYCFYLEPNNVFAEYASKVSNDITVALHEVMKCYRKLSRSGLPRDFVRLILPNAAVTELYMTANMREWRHILKLRLTAEAHPAVRRIAEMILEILRYECPNIFNDIKKEDLLCNN